MMDRMTEVESTITADQLARLSIPGRQLELVRGVLAVREPPGGWHGAVSNQLAYRMTAFVQERDLGVVFGQDTGFQIAADPDTVRAPDVAFVSRARMPGTPPEGYPALAPDIVVEILSPNDRPAETLTKVADWLAAGARLVWVLDSQRIEARVYRPDGGLSLLGRDDHLDGEDVLPGFRCRLSELLD